jgi:hypothetical protein
LTVLACVLVLTGIGGVLYFRAHERFAPLDPGAGTFDPTYGFYVRVLDLEYARPDDPLLEYTTLRDGEVALVARLALTFPEGEVGQYDCPSSVNYLRLVATDHRTWTASLWSDTDACDLVPQPETAIVRVTFTLPGSAADDILGIAFAHRMGFAPTWLLTPPTGLDL